MGLTYPGSQRIFDLDLIKKSLGIAEKYHRGQLRKSGEPYFSHPVAVAMLLFDHIISCKEPRVKDPSSAIVSAVLHDAVEDTELTLFDIRNEFGERIEQMVYRMTRVRGDKKITPKDIIQEAFRLQDIDVMLVKHFDRVHNMQTLGALSPDKQRKIREETLLSFSSASIYMGLEKEHTVQIMQSFEEDFLSFEDSDQLESLDFENDLIQRYYRL